VLLFWFGVVFDSSFSFVFFSAGRIFFSEKEKATVSVPLSYRGNTKERIFGLCYWNKAF